MAIFCLFSRKFPFSQQPAGAPALRTHSISPLVECIMGDHSTHCRHACRGRVSSKEVLGWRRRWSSLTWRRNWRCSSSFVRRRLNACISATLRSAVSLATRIPCMRRQASPNVFSSHFCGSVGRKSGKIPRISRRRRYLLEANEDSVAVVTLSFGRLIRLRASSAPSRYRMTWATACLVEGESNWSKRDRPIRFSLRCQI